jgi:hypothetical protein
MKTSEDREKHGTLVSMPRMAQKRSVNASREMSGDRRPPLAEAFQAKEARLQELVKDRDRFATFLQSAVLERLYRLQRPPHARSTGRRREPAQGGVLKIPYREIRQIAQDVRAEILSLEADVVTGFEFEAELRQLASASRHFAGLCIVPFVDPQCPALTREEGHRLLCIARSLLGSAMRCDGITEISMSLLCTGRQIRFLVYESGSQWPSRGLSVDLAELTVQADRIGGRVLVSRQPKFELTVLLDAAAVPPAASDFGTRVQ